MHFFMRNHAADVASGVNRRNEEDKRRNQHFIDAQMVNEQKLALEIIERQRLREK